MMRFVVWASSFTEGVVVGALPEFQGIILGGSMHNPDCWAAVLGPFRALLTLPHMSFYDLSVGVVEVFFFVQLPCAIIMSLMLKMMFEDARLSRLFFFALGLMFGMCGLLLNPEIMGR